MNHSETTDRGFIRHGLVRVKSYELLEAQPVLELLFGLRITQAVEMLQYHHAQQHANTVRWPTTRTGWHCRVVARPDQKGRLVLALGLNGFLMRMHLRLFKPFVPLLTTFDSVNSQRNIFGKLRRGWRGRLSGLDTIAPDAM